MEEKKFDVVTFGETMVMFYPETTGPLRQIHSFYRYMGGAESNYAIALSRLGFRTAWFSRLGQDDFGKFVLGELRREGVDVSHVAFDSERRTGLMFKEKFLKKNPSVLYYRKGSAASALSESDVDEAYIRQARFLHITGITAAISLSARKALYRALDIAKESHIPVSFDPNIRLKLWTADEARPVILDIAKRADIFLPGDDEGLLLTGLKKPEEIADYFLTQGCGTVAVKLGKDGAYVADKKTSSFVPFYPTEYKEDSAGAGDGFAAGFMAGHLLDLPLIRCAEIGNWIGALATLVRGDTEGYPDKALFESFLGNGTVVER